MLTQARRSNKLSPGASEVHVDGSACRLVQFTATSHSRLADYRV